MPLLVHPFAAGRGVCVRGAVVDVQASDALDRLIGNALMPGFDGPARFLRLASELRRDDSRRPIRRFPGDAADLTQALDCLRKGLRDPSQIDAGMLRMGVLLEKLGVQSGDALILKRAADQILRSVPGWSAPDALDWSLAVDVLVSRTASHR